MRQRSGFTLLELLIAAAIMSIVLAALGSLFAGTTRAYRVNERVSETQQNIEAAIQLLKHDIALAGYRGTDRCSGGRSFSNQPTLSVVAGSGENNPDRITIRYYEDRYVSETMDCMGDQIPRPVLQEVTFSIDTIDGTSNLFRQQGDNNQPVVAGVTNLKVVAYRDDAGLTIRLTFINGSTRDVSIVLHNPLG